MLTVRWRAAARIAATAAALLVAACAPSPGDSIARSASGGAGGAIDGSGGNDAMAGTGGAPEGSPWPDAPAPPDAPPGKDAESGPGNESGAPDAGPEPAPEGGKDVAADLAADAPADAGGDTQPDAPCGGGQTWCSGSCVSTSSDPKHCGGCGKACPAAANATPACSAATCGLLCSAGYADCDGKLQNGCEVDLQTSPGHCGGCGKTCPSGTNEAATCAGGKCGTQCQTGFAKVSGACGTFGGSFETNDPGCASCQAQNWTTSACSCPAGFAEAPALDTLDDCPGGGQLHKAQIRPCQTTTLPAGGDWAGAYEADDPVGCAIPCRAANPYTGGCSCPPGATAISLRTLVENSCQGIIGSTIVMCLRPAAPTATFGGAYEVDDNVPGGLGCRTNNPKTGACSCPAGTSTRPHRVIVDAPGNLILGSTLHVCAP